MLETTITYITTTTFLGEKRAEPHQVSWPSSSFAHYPVNIASFVTLMSSYPPKLGDCLRSLGRPGCSKEEHYRGRGRVLRLEKLNYCIDGLYLFQAFRP